MKWTNRPDQTSRINKSTQTGIAHRFTTAPTKDLGADSVVTIHFPGFPPFFSIMPTCVPMPTPPIQRYRKRKYIAALPWAPY